jgi:hypothetical protein
VNCAALAQIALIAVALGLGSACAAPAPPAKGSSPMPSLPPSPKLPRASWPRAVPEYVFSVRSHGGRPIGTDLDEFDWTLEVNSRLALLTLEYHRSDADIAGTPVGLFRKILPDDELKEFRKAVLAARLDRIDPSMTTHPGYTASLYRYTEADRAPIQVLLNNSNARVNAEIAPLATLLNGMLAGALQSPERAVRAFIEHKRDAGGEHLVVSVRNIGTEKVCLQDPLGVTARDPLHQAVIHRTVFVPPPPGDPGSDLDWHDVPLETPARAPQVPPAVVTLEPGEAWSHAVPLAREASRQYLAYFTLANGEGPATVRDAYCIRGRVDSNRVLIPPR